MSLQAHKQSPSAEPQRPKEKSMSKDELATDGGQRPADCQHALERCNSAGCEPNPLGCSDCLMRHKSRERTSKSNTVLLFNT